MKLSVYLAGLIIASLLASGCLAAILIYFDPFNSSCLIFILFYSGLFLAATSIFTLIGWLIRRVSLKRRLLLSKSQVTRQLEIAFRQGLLLSAILVSVLILQSQRILAWWNLLILVLLVGLAEWWLCRR